MNPYPKVDRHKKKFVKPRKVKPFKPVFKIMRSDSFELDEVDAPDSSSQKEAIDDTSSEGMV